VGLLAYALMALAAADVQAASKEARIALIIGEESTHFNQATMFVEAINKRLPGQFDFKIYPSNQLGKPNAIMDNIQLGSLEMAILVSTVIRMDKQLSLFDLPWLFKDRAHAKRAMTSQLGKEVVALIESKGPVVVGIYENGFRQVMNKVRPIIEPDDMKGLRIRISGGKSRANLFASFGANPTPTAWQETYTAIQTGVLDGVETATYAFYEGKMYEVLPYMSLTNHVYTPTFLLSSRKFWDGLTPEQHRVFKEVGESITDAAYKFAADLEKETLAKMNEHSAVNEIDFKSFQTATEQLYAEHVKAQGDNWLKLVRAAE
jgi:tripartite ATP-independent transporter DctP family solute receptor